MAVGEIDEDASRTIDATGLVVAPGFVDIHTHYDAQLFWDPTASPSPLHGVTTVIGGNCGFTIAPVAPQEADYLMRMLARVEGMPLESLEAGVPWGSWQTYGEWLDRLDGTIAVNAGFLVGHSALRRVVMGEGTGEPATDEQIAQMVQLLHESLAAGGLGFSSSNAPTHNDASGQPVPSRAATRDELVALAGAVRDHAGTTLEFIPTIGAFSEQHMDLMASMSLAANRPLNWNVLGVNAQNPDGHLQQLSASDYAADRGARVVALTVPDLMRFRLSLLTGFILDALPGWRETMALPPAEKMKVLADPDERRRLNEGANSPPRARCAAWPTGSTSPSRRRSRPRTTGCRDGRSATSRPSAARTPSTPSATSPSPTSSAPDGCPARATTTTPAGRCASACGATPGRARRVRRGRPPRHDRLVHLHDRAARPVRARAAAAPARGGRPPPHRRACPALRAPGRGRIEEGWQADVVVLDEDRVGPRRVYTRHDLPAGGDRLYGEADGIEHVLVNGVEIATAGEFTGDRPGTLLRSGRDTDTVEVPGGAGRG